MSFATNYKGIGVWPTTADFYKEFVAKAKSDPDYVHASCAAAVVVLQDAIERAGSADKKKVRDALAATNVGTFYGPVKFSANGMNEVRDLPIIQVQDKHIKVLHPADIKDGEMLLALNGIARARGQTLAQIAQAHGKTSADLKNFLLLAQVPSPTVSVPPNLNIAQVAEAGLELAGMTPADAQTFVQSIDWTSTLVIPVPRQGGSYQKQTVDGVEGELITMPQQGRRPAGYTLIWVKNGIIYSLADFSDPTEAVAMADSLQ